MSELSGWEAHAIQQRQREQAKPPQCAECERLRRQLAEWQAAREALEQARELTASAARYLESALSVVPDRKGGG